MNEKSINGIYIAFSLIITIVVVLWDMYLDKNVSIGILSTVLIAFGVSFTALIQKKEDVKNGIYLFLLFYAIYLIYSSSVHYGLINFYDVVNIVPDEEHYFYPSAIEATKKIDQGFTLFDFSDLLIYSDTAAMIYFMGIVGSFAEVYGENSVLLQKVSLIFVAALIPVVMYGISRLYFSKTISLNVAIVYGLFSFVPFLSTIILRDMHIALMFILTIYIVLSRLTIVNFILLLIVTFISYYLRPQTGIFMMGFVSVYFFIFIQSTIKNKYMQFFTYMSFLLITLVAVLNSPLMDMFNQISESSAGRSEMQASSSSMGAKMAKLPLGLNVVALFGFSQIQPFPPSLIFKGENRGIFELWHLLAGVSWFFGWGFLIYGLKVKKIFASLDLKVKLMFLFAMLYLILIATIEFNQRRQMAVYPIVYLLMVFSYLSMSISERTKMWFGMGIFYIILVVLLNYLKL